jgi:hypothetical protein
LANTVPDVASLIQARRLAYPVLQAVEKSSGFMLIATVHGVVFDILCFGQRRASERLAD